MKTTITHWLPIITFCPVNRLPDFIFISVQFNEFAELYAVRRKLRKLWFRRIFMEDAAKEVALMFPTAAAIEVRLLFNKHNVQFVRQ